MPAKRTPPDVQVATVHTTAGTSTLSMVQLKGGRARISVGDNLSSIQQCDARTTIQLNTQARTYLSLPFESAAPPDAAVLEARKKGGEVSYATKVTDTGETQPMFGFTARHLKSVVTKDFTLTACDQRPQQIETDGWYIDLPATVSCATLPSTPVTLQVDPKNNECIDQVTYQPPTTAVGYPVKYTSTSTTGDDAPVTTTMEVRQLERVDVEATLLEVPAEYVEVRTVAQLTADHRPGEPGSKKPGTLRVGLTPLSNRSDVRLETALLNEALMESFGDTDVDYVKLVGSNPTELEADAKAKEVDLVLTSTIAEVKTPRGGIVGKMAGTSGDAFTAKVDYSLVPPGQAKARASGSERSGGSTLNSAINIAKKVAQFAPPMLMAKYGYMNAYGSMLSQPGAATGAMRQTPDPVMNMAFSLLDKASAKTAPEQFSTQEGAVASALEKVLKSVVSDVGKATQDAAKRGR
ncbi:MAG: hypothetical protein ABL982_17575 [Vicinamibacterales bacterium]